jgi:2-haloacid dehalogenase
MAMLAQPQAISCAFSRRTLIGALAIGAISGPSPTNAETATQIRAIAFDALVIFDPRAVAAHARALFPEKGDILANIWTTKLFGYTWLETSAGRYKDFETLAGLSLQFAADSVGIELSDPARMELVETYRHLNAWPDVEPALARLRGARIRLRFLSNLSEAMLQANMRNAGIEEYFEPPLSTDRVRQFKPAPAAYQMAIDAFELPKEAIGYAAFGGWDAFGATEFGYRTVWVNRLGAPAERIEPKPVITSANMDGVLALAGVA